MIILLCIILIVAAAAQLLLNILLAIFLVRTHEANGLLLVKIDESQTNLAQDIQRRMPGVPYDGGERL